MITQDDFNVREHRDSLRPRKNGFTGLVHYDLKPTSTGGSEKLSLHSREKPKSQRRGGGSPRRESDVIHARRYVRPTWFDARGVHAKRKLIEGKGMPDVHNWRFITLTIDRKLFGYDDATGAPGDPLDAYRTCADHMRRFMYAARKEGLWKTEHKWCWKLEFHADGWPHWHLLVGRKTRMSRNQLRRLEALWGYGRTNVERVNERGFRYNFKYAFKAVQVEGEEGEAPQFAPDWFLDYIGKKTVSVKWTDADGIEQQATEEKAVSFARVRFWQTSRGFYTNPPKPASERKEQTTWIMPVAARVLWDRLNRSVQVVARDGLGRYLASATVLLDKPLEHFWNLIGFDTVHAGAVGLGVFSYVIPTHRLTTDPNTKWKLQPLLAQNRLTLFRARVLQLRGETLRTC